MLTSAAVSVNSFTSFDIIQKEMNSKATTCQAGGSSSYWSTSLGWVTSTNLVGLNGHFQTAVYAFQFHSGQQQTFRADRRSNFGRIPVTSVRRMSTKTGKKTQIRTHYAAHAAPPLALTAKTRSSCSSRRWEAVRWPITVTDADCLHRCYHFTVGKAMQRSSVNDHSLLSNRLKLVSIK